MASNGSATCIVSFDEQQKLPTPIRHVINESFEQLSSCITFIEQQNHQDKAVVLVTTTIDENILQTLEFLPSIEGILILYPSGKDVDILPSKVIGVYPQSEPLLQSLSQLLNNIEIQLVVRSFLFHQDQHGNENLQFYFYYLWRNWNKDSTSSKKSLADQSRLFFRSNNQIKSSIYDFETSYKPHDILSWFDQHRHPFPYHHLLFNALRTHNQETLSHARFFLNDMQKQMKPAPSGQVYLGTKLLVTLIDELEQRTKTDIIAFQCYLPVTRSRADALGEATRPIRRQKMTNVLFKIDLNSALCATKEDILYIDIGTPFQISCITRSSGAGVGQHLLTIVKLIALNKHDRDQLFEQFLQRQQKLGRTIEYLLKRMGSNIRLDYQRKNIILK